MTSLKKYWLETILAVALIIVALLFVTNSIKTDLSVANLQNEHPFYAELKLAHERMMGRAPVVEPKEKKTIAVLLYDGFAALDAVGPMQAFSTISADYNVVTVAKTKGNIVAEDGVKMVADYDFSDVPTPDVILIPGGLMGTIAASKDQEILNWIREMDKVTSFTTSVCTGSWILAAAGVLEGKDASTHWTGAEHLEKLGAIYTGERYTEDGKYITSAGVSGGIDMGIALVAKLKGDDAGKTAELIMEYDPQPPFDAGTPEKADPELVDIIFNMNREHINAADQM